MPSELTTEPMIKEKLSAGRGGRFIPLSTGGGSSSKTWPYAASSGRPSTLRKTRLVTSGGAPSEAVLWLRSTVSANFRLAFAASGVVKSPATESQAPPGPTRNARRAAESPVLTISTSWAAGLPSPVWRKCTSSDRTYESLTPSAPPGGLSSTFRVTGAASRPSSQITPSLPDLIPVSDVAPDRKSSLTTVSAPGATAGTKEGTGSKKPGRPDNVRLSSVAPMFLRMA
jgi:hypothetical protein